jgi:type IV pilus assembly protein PilA
MVKTVAGVDVRELHPSAVGRRDQQGFTLIELMVVLLIIGILMAIAIPTYLGERNHAEDKAAQTTLRNALGTIDALYTQNGDFETVLPLAVPVSVVQAAEPAIQWSQSSSGPNQVGVQATGHNSAVMVAKSLSGKCFWIMDVETDKASIIRSSFYNSETITGAGVWYATRSPGGPGGSCELGLSSPWVWYRSTGAGW